nr:hypothetical protein [Paenibacillus sp. AR247]
MKTSKQIFAADGSNLKKYVSQNGLETRNWASSSTGVSIPFMPMAMSGTVTGCTNPIRKARLETIYTLIIRLTIQKSSATRFYSVMGRGAVIIQELATAVRHRGMRLGLPNHFAENWWFFKHSEEQDTSDPIFAKLYNAENELTEAHVKKWYDFSIEQLELFKPDLFYYNFEIAQPEFKEQLRKIAIITINRPNGTKASY